MDDYLFDSVLIHGDESCLDWLDINEISNYLVPSTEKWDDVSPSSGYPTKITLDNSKVEQWELAKQEIEFVRENLNKLIFDKNKENDNGTAVATEDDVICYILGPNSDIGLFLQQHLNISAEKYIDFMCTLCIQSSYKVSSTQLFHRDSLLSQAVPMDQKDYNEIWLNISSLKKVEVQNSFVGAGRREKCIWEHLEEIVNNLCRSISVSNRPGKISIALDDDKIWVSLSGRNKDDLFGIKYTTHNKANRKGIVAHTAVSTGANLPLGIIFEKQKDTSGECFECLLKFLFERNGNCDLRNITIASDRGYMLPNIVFNFLIKNGSDFIGTTKRMAQCWPFTFDQKLKPTDQRRKIEPKGPPTLFVKKVRRQIKNVFAIAFRNGSESVSTAISSIHRNHHWEGIVVNPVELQEYEVDPQNFMLSHSFSRVKSDMLSNDETEGEKELISHLIESVIDVQTIRDGK